MGIFCSIIFAFSGGSIANWVDLISLTSRPEIGKSYENALKISAISRLRPRLSAMPFNENPFAAGSASGLRPDYSNSIRSYLRNCRGCYWQNPIIPSTYISQQERNSPIDDTPLEHSYIPRDMCT